MSLEENVSERCMQDLYALGATYQDVADNLHKLGITGLADNCYDCPLANYLKMKGYKNPDVSYYTANVDENSSVVVILDLPEACSMFIVEFDYGKYPNLQLK